MCIPCSYLYKETCVDYFVIIFVKKSLYILSIEIYIFYTITIDIFYSCSFSVNGAL